MTTSPVPDPGTPESASEEMDLETARLILAEADGDPARFGPDSRVLFGAWGVAWFVGYLVLWLTARPEAGASPDGATPAGWAFVVFYGLLVSAVAITIVHITRRTRGVRGESATSGAMFGWAWAVAFTVVGLVIGALGRADVAPEAMALISNALPCLTVGTLYMAGASMYRDRWWFALGAWIALVAGAATMVGLPGTYLVMSLAGGGGMLVGAVACHVAARRGRRP